MALVGRERIAAVNLHVHVEHVLVVGSVVKVIESQKLTDHALVRKQCYCLEHLICELILVWLVEVGHCPLLYPLHFIFDLCLGADVWIPCAVLDQMTKLLASVALLPLVPCILSVRVHCDIVLCLANMLPEQAARSILLRLAAAPPHGAAPL